MGIDREALIETTLFGQGVPARQPIPSAYDWAVSDDIDTTYVEHDPEAAQDMLAESGHEEASFELMTSNAPPHNDAAEVLQSQLSDLGLDVEVQIVDIPTFVDRVVDQNFETFFQGFSDVTEPDYITRTANSCGATLNRGNYCNQDFDEMMEKAARTYDIEERAQHYHDVQQHYANYLPDIPIWFMPSARAVRTEVGNFEHHITAVRATELTLSN